MERICTKDQSVKLLVDGWTEEISLLSSDDHRGGVEVPEVEKSIISMTPPTSQV